MKNISYIAIGGIGFASGILVTIIVLYFKNIIKKETLAWVIDGVLFVTSIFCLIWGGYVEYQRPSPGGILIAVSGLVLLAATGIVATLATKFETEEKMMKIKDEMVKDLKE